MGGRDGEVGFVLADEAFQGSCPHMVVRPTALCQPEKLNGCCHTAGLTTHPVSQRDPAPLAPLDPASGSRTGGALRGGAGERWRALGRFAENVLLTCAFSGLRVDLSMRLGGVAYPDARTRSQSHRPDPRGGARVGRRRPNRKLKALVMSTGPTGRLGVDPPPCR